MLDALKGIGLSDGEIKVYEILATCGEQTILALSKSARMNRSYCYEILEHLLAKGFAAKLLVNNKTLWKALPRENILARIEEVKHNVDESLQKLQSKNNSNPEREITIFKGPKGVKAVCDSITESKTKVIGFGAEGQIRKYLPYSYNHILNKVKKNKTRFELITLKNKVPAIKDLTKTKSFKKEFDTCVEINVWEDKTVLFFWKPDLDAIVIKDLDVANSFRNYHRIFWKNL
jgi:sugar-specific transcriptional regulator TrmB